MLRAIQARDQFDMPMVGAIQQADTVFAVVLAANTSQQIPIPATIAGSVSGTFQAGETVTQTGTNVTGTCMNVPGSSGPLILGALSSFTGANATGTWTGGTSGATCTPTAAPVPANLVLFSVSGGNDFYALFANSSISVPASNVTTGAAPEINPQMRACAGKTYVSLVAAFACVVTMAFYQ